MTTAPLLGAGDPPLFTIERADGGSPFLLTGDHAGQHVPRQLDDLGLSAEALGTHVASDLGIAGLGRRLATHLDAFAILHNYSRLVVDANRPPDSPESILVLSERTRIPRNEDVSTAEAAQRRAEVFDPYHARIAAEIDRRTQHGRRTVLVALHSFTPRYLDVDRPWHVGVLHRGTADFGRTVVEHLRRDATLVVGDNEPYALDDASDYTVLVHGEQREIPFVELEVRQDLLADADGRERWAARLAAVLRDALSGETGTR